MIFVAKTKVNLEDSLKGVKNAKVDRDPTEEEVENMAQRDGDGPLFLIAKRDKEKNKLKRSTYYIRSETLDKIEQYSEQTGYGKSELVRMALKNFFDSVRFVDPAELPDDERYA